MYCVSNKEMIFIDIIVVLIFNVNFILDFKLEIVLFNIEFDFKKFEIVVF